MNLARRVRNAAVEAKIAQHDFQARLLAVSGDK